MQMIFSKFKPLKYNGENEIYGIDKKLGCEIFKHNYYFCEDLMWAHYANGYCGVRIDFSIQKDLEASKIIYSNKIKKISKKDNDKLYAKEIPQKFIQGLLNRKKTCWKYEQEYRIFSLDRKIPIEITKITLGKKFANLTISNIQAELSPFSENIIRVAKQIMEILINTKKYTKEKCPEIWAYKTMYSSYAQKVELNDK